MLVSTERKSLLVLWIEDDLGIVSSFRQRFRSERIQLEIANDAVTALEAGRRRIHDVWIVDPGLPGTSGLDVLKRLRDDGIRTPAIVLTGNGSEVLAFRAGQMGFVHYETKPISPADLVGLIKRVAGNDESSSTLKALDTCSDPTRPVRHPWTRWADAIDGILDVEIDPKTELLWAVRHRKGVSVAALRKICDRVEIYPMRALWIARLLRAILLARHEGGQPEDFLDADMRTLRKVLVLVGIDPGEFRTIDPITFVKSQRMIVDPRAILALVEMLVRTGRARIHE